jgi:hypothetical protein
MFLELASHNEDLRRLLDRGYAVAVDTNYLVVRDIPYLDQDGALQTAAIVTKLVFTDEHHVTQDDHQIWFAGGVPHDLGGKPIPNLGGGAVNIPLSDACKDVVVQRSFSNKPTTTGRFADFSEKIESYVTIISGPAIERHGANPRTFRQATEDATTSVFQFRDTLTSRAAITDLAKKFHDDVIAVIGLGGTGSYVLDLIVKTPVREIRGFDGDPYHVHNAFRSPGRLTTDELSLSKAAVYQGRYENFRNGITLHTKYVDASCADDLRGVTFAFVCVDKGSARAQIFELLITLGIPFLDVGMGLHRKRNALDGMLRTTYYSAADAKQFRDRGYAELTDAPDEEYRTNIQTAELNALNASLAVIRYKQLRGFYHDTVNTTHLLFGVSDLSVGREDG